MSRRTGSALHRASSAVPACLLSAALLLAGCKSSTASGPPTPAGASGPAAASAPASGATGGSGSSGASASGGSLTDPDFGRTLQALDKRVDEFLRLATEPGEEATARRTILGAALDADADKHRDALLRALADPAEPTRRRIAAKALAFGNDPRTPGALLAQLRPTEEPAFLAAALFAVGRRADAATPLAPLLTLAEHPDRDVRNNALLAVGRTLDARTDAGAGPLDAGTAERALAIVEGALFDPDDPIVRGHAAAAMGALGDGRGTDPLLNLLRDPHPFVRTQTSIALGKLGDRRAIPALVSLIDESPRGTVRSALLVSIAALVEAAGFRVPEDLPDDERSWRAFVERTVGFSFDAPSMRRR